MPTHLLVRSLSILVVSVTLSSCGSKSSGNPQPPGSPTTPSPPSAATLTAPAPVSPMNGEQLSSLRATLTVQNGSSTGQGAKTYDFQVSDRSDFTVGAALSGGGGFLVSVAQTGVAEGADGRTSFMTPELQPTTRMYWRARLVQGSAASEWSAPAMFRTKLVGYSRAGELYDPLVHPNETIGTVFGPHTWVPGKGIRLDTQNSYVRYHLEASIPSGEFSVEVEGLHPNGPAHKLKIFSMSDTVADTSDSDYQMSTMYRGVTGNPDNCIAFKAVFGSDSRIVEPDKPTREASVRSLNPAQTYFWRATWGSFFRLMVAEGGINGSPIYDLELPARSGATYNPSPTFAYLGSNQSVFRSDAGTFPGATYRHLWIGNRPRPATLGNALDE
jgi:hypothetical protein